MLCVTPLITYTCSNSRGSACLKTPVSIPNITGSTSCTDSEFLLLTKTEYDALISKDDALETEIAKGLTLHVKPYEAQADDYASISAIFAIALVAGCVIWGLKQVFRILRNPSEA